MRKKPVLLLGLLAAGWCSVGAASECAKDELTFNFSNIPVRDAFSVLADFAGLRPRLDPAITESTSIRFTCLNWRVAAEDLARKHHLRLTIDGGVLQVSK